VDAAHRALLRELTRTPIDGYRVEEYIASGGTASVFRAVRGGATVALKVFTLDTSVEESRSEQEARIARAVDAAQHAHQNVVRVFGGGRCPTTGYLYLIMELVRGATIAELTPSFPRELITRVIAGVANGARHLEELKLVHRDIKPSNVMLREPGREPVLLDLGVVRPFDSSELTGTDQFLATKRYSPPELLGGAKLQGELPWRAVTFYQLGGLLHDMLMRRKLFAELAGDRLVAAIGTVTPAIDTDAEFPQLSRVARVALSKRAGDRLSSLTWDSFAATKPQPSGDSQIDFLDLPRFLQDVEREFRVACGQASPPARLFMRRSRSPANSWILMAVIDRDSATVELVYEFQPNDGAWQITLPSVGTQIMSNVADTTATMMAALERATQGGRSTQR
jgi:serine/threonine protein kinase